MNFIFSVSRQGSEKKSLMFKDLLLVTLVEAYPKAHFLIDTTPRCRGGLYNFPWIAPH